MEKAIRDVASSIEWKKKCKAFINIAQQTAAEHRENITVVEYRWVEAVFTHHIMRIPYERSICCTQMFVCVEYTYYVSTMKTSAPKFPKLVYTKMHISDFFFIVNTILLKVVCTTI